jgi:hypothetical protein
MHPTSLFRLSKRINELRLLTVVLYVRFAALFSLVPSAPREHPVAERCAPYPIPQYFKQIHNEPSLLVFL